MAEFCFQCSVDLDFGPYSDFAQFGQPGGVLHDHPDKVVGVICEGCGNVFVDRRGYCVSTDCLSRHSDIPPERGEVYRSAQRWVDRRSGPLGPLLRLRDRCLGTPWDPGYIHYLRWRWNNRDI